MKFIMIATITYLLAGLPLGAPQVLYGYITFDTAEACSAEAAQIVIEAVGDDPQLQDAKALGAIIDDGIDELHAEEADLTIVCEVK